MPVIEIENITKNNLAYRQGVYYDLNVQIVLMSLNIGEEIGAEIHENSTQIIRIESGSAKVIINDQSYIVGQGQLIVIHPGALHNVINISETDLKLYTIYSPPIHEPRVFQVDKPENEDDF